MREVTPFLKFAHNYEDHKHPSIILCSVCMPIYSNVYIQHTHTYTCTMHTIHIIIVPCIAHHVPRGVLAVQAGCNWKRYSCGTELIGGRE